MLWDTESAVQRAARTPATGLPVEFGAEALGAGYKFTVDEEKSTSLERALWDEYDAYIDQVEQRTGKRLRNPIGFAPGERVPGATGQLGAQVRLRREQEAIGDPVTGMPGFEAQLAKLREAAPDLPAPPTVGQLLDNITKRLGLAREQYQDLQSRMTMGGSIADFIGSMGGLATDPLVAATMPFGAGATRPLVAKMLIEAGIAGASELAVQPYVMRGKEAIDSPYSMAEAAGNVLAAAGLGAAFPVAGALLHGLGSKGVRALERAFDRETPVVRAATKTERAAMADLERAFTAEETSPTAPADLPAHVKALDDEVVAVRETGAPSRAVPEVPIEPERARVVAEEQKLDDVTRAEIETLAREDAQLAGAIEAVQSIRVYHGSPHRFDRFSMEKIGIGEGAQVYGHGLYFSEDRAVAQGYLDRLGSGGGVNPADTASRIWEAHGRDKEAALADIDGRIADIERRAVERPDTIPLEGGQALDEAMAGIRERWQTVRALVESGEPRGSIYTVDLAVDRDELLDWHKPLFEQSEKMKAALTKAGYPLDERTGEELVKEIEGRQDGGRAILGADEVLREYGIKGVRYIGDRRLTAGEGAPNIVMFDDSLVHIREINGVPIPDPAEAAKDLAEFTGSKAEDAILTADVERALGAKAPPEPAPDAPKPAEPPKPILDPELAKLEVPVGEAIDPDTGERIATTRTAAELLDELEADRRTLDEMAICASPLPTKAPKA